jgi:hypothetical protein
VRFFSKLLLSALRYAVFPWSSSSSHSRFILDFVFVHSSVDKFMVVLLGWLDCFNGRIALGQQNHPSSTAFKNCKIRALRIGSRSKLIDCRKPQLAVDDAQYQSHASCYKVYSEGLRKRYRYARFPMEKTILKHHQKSKSCSRTICILDRKCHSLATRMR